MAFFRFLSNNTSYDTRNYDVLQNSSEILINQFKLWNFMFTIIWNWKKREWNTPKGLMTNWSTSFLAITITAPKSLLTIADSKHMKINVTMNSFSNAVIQIANTLVPKITELTIGGFSIQWTRTPVKSAEKNINGLINLGWSSNYFLGCAFW